MGEEFEITDAPIPWEPSPADEGVNWQDIPVPKGPSFHAYINIPHSEPEAVQNTAILPYAGICSVHTANFHLGSGLLIAPTIVLTAAHVIADGVEATKPTNEMRSLRVTIAGAFQEIRVSKAFYFDPAATKEGQPRDFALLKLQGRSNTMPIKVARTSGPPMKGTPVEISGYPSRLQQIRGKGVVVDQDQLWLDYNASTDRGHSGAPVIFRGVAVGLHTVPAGYHPQNILANRGLWLRPEVLQWIDRFA